jgi:hypothetical protein
MIRGADEARALTQEIYLQELVSAIYRRYAARLRDEAGRRILLDYLKAEGERRLRIERHLQGVGLVVAPPVRSLFRWIGGLYGGVTSLLGTRIMLRIVLSASGRASRRACAALGPDDRPDLVYLATLKARNEGDLVGAMRQHLIDTRSRRSR